MNESDRIRGIAAKLLAKTEANEANWLPKSGDIKSCTLRADALELNLIYISPVAEHDQIELQIIHTGRPINSFSSARFRAYIDVYDNGSPDFDQQERDDSQLLSRMYRSAMKTAYRFDDILDEADRVLSGSGDIGLPF